MFKRLCKRGLFIVIFTLGSLTMRPRRGFAMEPLPIVKIVNENPGVEVFEFDCFVSPGKVGKVIVNFKPRSLEEQLVHEKMEFELQKKEESGRYGVLRMLEPNKRFEEQNRINLIKPSLDGKNSSYFIREELAIDSPLRQDHFVKGKLVKGITHRTRPPYYEVVDNKVADQNRKLVEANKQLVFENQLLQEKLKNKK